MTLREHLHQAEREYIEALLVSCDWNVSLTAKQAGCTRDWVYRLMHIHSIERPEGFRPRTVYGNPEWQALGRC